MKKEEKLAHKSKLRGVFKSKEKVKKIVANKGSDKTLPKKDHVQSTKKNQFPKLFFWNGPSLLAK